MQVLCKRILCSDVFTAKLPAECTSFTLLHHQLWNVWMGPMSQNTIPVIHTYTLSCGCGCGCLSVF